METDQYFLVVRSIGTATFSDCLRLAQTLDLPTAPIVRSIYKAPFVLTESSRLEDVQSVKEALSGFGFEMAVESEPPEPALSYDVAIRLEDYTNEPQVCEVITAFVGGDIQAARQQLNNAPPIMLGDVSIATVNALKERLSPLSALVLETCRTTARYDLFAFELPILLKEKVALMVGKRWVETGPGDATIVRNLSHEKSEDLWRHVGRQPNVLLVSQDFHLWDIWLKDGSLETCDPELLSELTEIPKGIANRVIESCPIVIESNVRHEKVNGKIDQLSEAGFEVEGELTTLRYFQLEIEKVSDRKQVEEVLSEHGVILSKKQMSVGGGSGTFQIAPPLSDNAAHVLRHKLEEIGCLVQMQKA